MGVFNNVDGNLRGYADKIIKFKQLVLLEAANTQKLISDENYKLVKDGQCTAFSMMWIAQQYGIDNYFHRGQGVKSREDNFSLNTTALANDSAMKYRCPPPGNIFTNESKNLADTWGLRVVGELEESERGKEHALKWFKDWASDYYDDKTAVYVVCSIEDRDGKMRDGSHAMALFCDENGYIHFFDPNVGEYLIHNDQPNGFFNEYTKVLRRVYNWVYRQAWALRIERKNG